VSYLDRWKLFGIVFAVALVLAFAWSFISPLLVGWPLALYVCWRALPAVRSDIDAIRRHFFPAREWRI
jgi:hypothetical protein